MIFASFRHSFIKYPKPSGHSCLMNWEPMLVHPSAFDDGSWNPRHLERYNRLVEIAMTFMTTTLKMFLQSHGMTDFSEIKIVRHQDSRLQEKGFDMFELAARTVEGIPLIEWYQSAQGKDVFGTCKRIVSFYVNREGQTVFLGVYEVKGRRSEPMPAAVPVVIWEGANYFYELERDRSFDDLAHRVVIDWGKSYITWHQWLDDKKVLEVLPSGYLKPFPGYDRVILKFAELCHLVKYEAGNREWRHRLSAVDGVYLITDQRSGQQYVGSAYGSSVDDGGIWGRWRAYALSGGKGGNVGLEKLLAEDPERSWDFTFSLLQIVERGAKTSVQQLEAIWKQKLGSRTHGLNEN